MTIDDLLTNSGDDIYYSEGFHVVLESYLTYLRNSNTNTVTTIEPAKAYKYEGDFYGLLDSLNIHKKYHYAILRINDYRSSNDFTADTQTIIIPDLTEIDLIKTIYNTRKSTLY